MFGVELEKPFQLDISDEFLDIIRQLKETQKPGRMFDLAREPTKKEMSYSC